MNIEANQTAETDDNKELFFGRQESLGLGLLSSRLSADSDDNFNFCIPIAPMPLIKRQSTQQQQDVQQIDRGEEQDFVMGLFLQPSNIAKFPTTNPAQLNKRIQVENKPNIDQKSNRQINCIQFGDISTQKKNKKIKEQIATPENVKINDMIPDDSITSDTQKQKTIIDQVSKLSIQFIIFKINQNEISAMVQKNPKQRSRSQSINIIQQQQQQQQQKQQQQQQQQQQQKSKQQEQMIQQLDQLNQQLQQQKMQQQTSQQLQLPQQSSSQQQIQLQSNMQQQLELNVQTKSQQNKEFRATRNQNKMINYQQQHSQLFNSQIKKSVPFVPCTCTKTQCLKMYCSCFHNGRRCSSECLCEDCKNQNEFYDNIKDAIQHVKQKAHRTHQPNENDLFNTQSVWGCNCKRTRCQKRYCECFIRGKKCNQRCNCEDCENGRDEISNCSQGDLYKRRRKRNTQKRYT